MAYRKDKLLVAAIDFGTTHSSYAYSFRHDYKKDPLKISTKPSWMTGSSCLETVKVPTCVLLSPRQEFMAFGYEAENMYSDLAFYEKHYGYYFFKGFKMVPFKEGVSIICLN